MTMDPIEKVGHFGVDAWEVCLGTASTPRHDAHLLPRFIIFTLSRAIKKQESERKRKMSFFPLCLTDDTTFIVFQTHATFEMLTQ